MSTIRPLDSAPMPKFTQSGASAPCHDEKNSPEISMVNSSVWMWTTSDLDRTFSVSWHDKLFISVACLTFQESHVIQGFTLRCKLLDRCTKKRRLSSQLRFAGEEHQLVLQLI